MRLVLALVTSALLTSAAAAQTIAPEFGLRGGAVAYAPALDIAPAAPAPSALGSASLDKAELSPSGSTAQVAALPTAVTAAVPSVIAPEAAEAPVEKLHPPRKPRASVARSTVSKPEAQPERSERSERHPRARTGVVANSGHRDLGRFWPPAF